MPTSTEKRSHRDSWPPTQIYLRPTVSTMAKPLPSLDDIDNDPLTYFLTPAPDIRDEDMDDEMLDFDAGIEGASQSKDIVRSVSPSTLDGLRKPGLRRPTSPESCSDTTMSDCDANSLATMFDEDDDDEEDYIRFSPGRDGLVSLRDTLAEQRPRSPTVHGLGRSPTRPTTLGTAGAALLAPASPTSRGRTRGRGQGGLSVPAMNMTVRRRPGQLWREPSPDVWSIEEETEDEVVRSGGSPMTSTTGGKPKKKVRFVLPARVD